jgi:hypothetical protein
VGWAGAGGGQVCAVPTGDSTNDEQAEHKGALFSLSRFPFFLLLLGRLYFFACFLGASRLPEILTSPLSLSPSSSQVQLKSLEQVLHLGQQIAVMERSRGVGIGPGPSPGPGFTPGPYQGQGQGQGQQGTYTPALSQPRGVSTQQRSRLQDVKATTPTTSHRAAWTGVLERPRTAPTRPSPAPASAFAASRGLTSLPHSSSPTPRGRVQPQHQHQHQGQWGYADRAAAAPHRVPGTTPSGRAKARGAFGGR